MLKNIIIEILVFFILMAMHYIYTNLGFLTPPTSCSCHTLSANQNHCTGSLNALLGDAFLTVPPNMAGWQDFYSFYRNTAMRIHNINVGARAIALNIALQMIASRQHLNSFLPVLPLLIQFWGREESNREASKSNQWQHGSHHFKLWRPNNHVLQI